MKHYTKKDIYKKFATIFTIVAITSLVVFVEAIWLIKAQASAQIAESTAILILSMTLVVLVLIWCVTGYFLSNHFAGIVNFYVSVLDSIPTPIAVTDLDMNTVFINKAAEVVCEVSRSKFIGAHLDKSWDEGVCAYGVESLRDSKPWTLCHYRGRNYQLETSYLYKNNYTEIGHVEVLQDIRQMENLFNAINSSILITDIETDEIIFMSESFKKMNNFKDSNYVGKPCWKAIFNNSARCHDCNKDKIAKSPDSSIEWEYHDPVTNRHYKNIDSVAKWALGGTVYARRMIDISDRKEAESFMKKRLDQQELMTTISLAFLSTSNIQDSIMSSLELSGEFLDSAHIVLSKYEKENQVLRLEQEWNNKNYKNENYLPVLPFSPFDGLYIELLNNKKKFVIGYSNLDADMYPDIFKTGIKTFIAIPIYLSNGFWGIVRVEYTEDHKWDRSDISLSLFLGNILSGVLRRKKTEADLMRMSSIANNSPQFISYNDIKGNYLFINNGASDMTGYDYREITEGGLKMLHGEEMARKIVDEYFPQVIDFGKLSFETPVYHKNGKTRIFSVSAFFIADLESGIGMIANDVTEQRQLEQELLAAKDQAEQANRGKSEFLYRMSHEMRTPMTSIIGMTDIAKTTQNFAQISYCLEQVENASNYLLSVINDVIDMSKIEANQLELVYDDLDLYMLIRRVTGMFSFLIDKSKLNLTVHMDDDVPEIIISDKLRVSQVLTNLLSNAVRFSPEDGDVVLSVKTLSKENDTCTLKIEVTDHGVGDYTELNQPLFDSLDDAGGHILHKYAGSNVGLSIAKRIVELMGGEISYESNPTTGSTIAFTLRAKIGTPLDIVSFPEDDDYFDYDETLSMDGRYAGKVALLAEDVDINCDIFVALLGDTEIEVDCAQNGIEACSMFRKAPQRYDIIIMDIHMPEMNGLDATKIIREMDIPEAKIIPIIALTADVFKEDIDKCLSVGMNGHIAKPMDFNDIIKNLDHYLL